MNNTESTVQRRLVSFSAIRFSTFAGLVLTLPLSAQAAQRTWTGLGSDALWSTSANWDSGAPAATDTALFSGTGNSKTAVSLGGTVTNSGVAFSANAAPYTIGTSDETLNLAGGNVSLPVGASSDQTIAATLLLGGTVNIYNNEISRTLFISNLTVNANRNLYIRGSGPVTFGKFQRPVANEVTDANYMVVETRINAPITCTDRMTLGELWNYDYPLNLNLAPHTTNIFCRNNWCFTSQNFGGVVNGGEGTVLILRQADSNPGRYAIQSSTVTMNVQLSGPSGLSCVGGWTRGTLVLANPSNDFAGSITVDRGNCVEVPYLAATNTVQPLGKGSSFIFNNPLDVTVPARLRVTGSTPSSSDRIFSIDKDSAAIENAGSGLVTLTGPISGIGTVIFDGAGPLTYSGVRSGTGGLTKSGGGTLTLTATNTYSGATVINSGTLVLAGGTLGTTSALTLTGGGALSLNPSNTAGFSLTLPATTVNGSGRLIVAAPASGTSTVTITSLTLNATNSTFSITAPNAGDSNRIVISNLVAGPVAWIMLNGSFATYSAATGLTPLPPASTNHIATLGPGATIPDASGSAAVIDTEGTSGPVTLASGLTSLALLSQEYPTGALVDFGGGILAANIVRQDSGAGALTLQNGILTANGANTNVVLAGIGTLFSVTLTNDAATGISTAKTYTHLLDFGNQAAATINGKTFTKTTSASGTAGSYGWSGFPTSTTHFNWTDWTNNIPPATGAGLRALLYDMVYSGGNDTVKLTGLTPGAAYEFRLFLRPWEARPTTTERTARYDFITDASAAPVATGAFDMNRDPIALVLRYIATTSELTIKNYNNANSSPGFFGITNEKLADAPAVLATGRAALTFITAGTAPLVVSAAVTDNGRTTAVLKEGDGTLTLAGPVSHTSTTTLNGGTVDLAPSNDVTQTFASTIAGSSAIIKRGAGNTLFLGANTYAGTTVISNGILSVADSSALGSTAPGTVVTPGGALALGSALAFGSTTAKDTLVISEPITIAGAGPDGLGALRNDTLTSQINAFKYITLSGPATVGGISPVKAVPYSVAPTSTGRFDLRSGIFDFAGYPLTKAGPGAFMISASTIIGITPTASIDITGGVFGLEATDLRGSAANTLTVRSDAAFDIVQLANPLSWSMVLTNQAHLTARSNSATNQNLLTGPVSLTGSAVLDGAYHDTLSGVLSGPGGLVKSAGFTHLTGTNNTYAGTTAVTNGVLLTLVSSTLPSADFARVSVSANGILAVRNAGASGDQPGWSDTEIGTLASSGAFISRSASLGFETVYEDRTYSGTMPTLAGVAKLGPRKLTLETAPYDLGPVTVFDGELNLFPAPHSLSTYSITVGNDPLFSSLAVLPLSGTTTLLTTDPGYNRAGPVVSVGAVSTSRGILSLDGTAAVSGRLYLGAGNNNAEGAVYQTGGSFLNTAGSGNDGRIGLNGHGYYEISGGTLTNKGYTQLGVNTGVSGILRQTGGSVAFNSGTVPSTGVIADYYGGNFAVRAGLGLFHLTGGTFTTGTTKLSLGEYDAVNNYNDGTGILTLEGSADASVDFVELANRNNVATSIVNLNGGTLATRYLIKGGSNNNLANSRAFINFNGGTLRLTAGGSAIRTAANNSNAVLTVSNADAFIDVVSNMTSSLDLPLSPLTGQGLVNIDISTRGAGYIAPPFVNITGGGGFGATAVATVDRVTGQLSTLRITSPGMGYTSAPTVSLVGGGYTTIATLSNIRIGANTAAGGLTKLGSGTLVLNTNNTFRGIVTVSNGLLAVRAPAAIPQGANLVLNGGLIDLGGGALTNTSITLSSGGGLLNGSAVTYTLRKEGAGAAEIAAGITIAPPYSENATPGLYEGRLTNRLNRTEANPRTSVQFTTRAVNGALVASGGTINGCQWPDQTCYVYTGYLWNRTGTNVVWTFGENFDDNVYLLIDGKAILDNDVATTPTYRNVQLLPGPHAFEVRCGQNTNNVGALWVRTDTTRIGFGVDFQGRAQNVADNYQPLADPGDGSLFTLELPASYTNSVVVSAPSLPALPAEVAANVGALANGYALVYAADVPATGGIINGSVAGTRYSVNNALSDTNDFDRVAYYLELNHPTYGNQWVWVSFDAVTRDRTLIGYPFHDSAAGAGYCANIFQRKVDNMDVRSSNVAGITNYVGSATGSIEFWPNDYSTGDALGLGADGGTYDFGDIMNNGPVSTPGHGSFQVHNWGDKTTLFAMDNWGNGNNTISLGIGKQPSGHPDWTFNYNGTNYTYRRLYVLTRDIVRTPKMPSATVAEGTLRLPSMSVTHPIPADIRDKVGAVASEYAVVYASAVPSNSATIVNGTAYSIDNSSYSMSFDRVAYYLELVHPTYGNQWIWVSFDAHTQDRKKLGYPSQTGNLFTWQQKVTNMNVICSGVLGVTNYASSATGNIEIWPSNYAPNTTGLGLGGSGATFDFDDLINVTTNSAGHGCFQIHNWGDKTTLLSITRLGSGANPIGIGIGNDPTSSTDKDYTFNYNAYQYSVRNFYVAVRPALRSTNALASVDLTVNAGATLDLGGATQTVHSVTGAGTVSNGILSAGSVLSPAGDGTVGTLALSGVQFASGVLYRADLGDRLDVTGSLDVSNMVLHINNPAALARSQTYTLIQTTAGVTGAPTLDAPLPSRWKLIRRDNALLLFSEGGSVILLR